MEFSKQKNGYNITEVDEYIASLKSQNDYKISSLNQTISNLQAKIDGLSSSLSAYKSKKESISSALISAVEKANQIEESSKNVYRLKIQQLAILYKKWEFMLEEMLKKHPDLTETASLSQSVETFRQSMKEILENDFQFQPQAQQQPKQDPIRALLQKINSRQQLQPPVESKPEIKMSRPKRETKPITNANVVEQSVAEQFLSSADDCDETFPFSSANQSSTSSSGFDLAEAVNPKEDLEQIMRAFDFFAENE